MSRRINVNAGANSFGISVNYHGVLIVQVVTGNKIYGGKVVYR